MLFFIIKKTFFDMWDNLFQVMFINVGFLLLACGFLLLPSIFFPELSLIGSIIYIVSGVILYSIFIGAAARFTMDISDYKHPGFRDFFRYLRETWKQNLTFPLAVNLSIAVMGYVILFYYSQASIIYYILGGIVLWTWVTMILASFYFHPVFHRLKKTIRKSVRTSFILYFDNTAFTFFMILILIVILALSVILLTILPGIGTILLWINVCFKIRLYKYDYLEEHPDANRKKIPWDELIMTDEKKVGKRTLRGMIFPWKQ